MQVWRWSYVREAWLGMAYSNLWIALAAGGHVLVNFRLLGCATPWQPVLLAVLAMFWVYTFAKAVCFDAEADEVNDPGRTAFLKANRRVLIALAALGLVGGTFLAASHGWAAVIAFWIPTVVGLLYDIRLLPGTFRYRRLKDVPGLKGTSVALAWAALITGLVFSYGPRQCGQACLFLFIWNALQWFINTTYFDLGDISGDRLEGTATLPVLLGFQPVRTGLHLLNIVTAALLMTAIVRGWVSPIGARLLWLHALQALLLIRAKNEDTDISWECDIVFDGIFVLGALLTA